IAWRRECGTFHTTYAADMALRPTPLARARIAIVIFAALASGGLAGRDGRSIANQVGIAPVGALGLNVLVGFTGQISVAQGAFLGVGAYTSAYLTTRIGVPFWVALPAAGLVTAAVGGVFGIPSLRLKGLYLVIATLAAQVVIEWFMIHLVPVTVGRLGTVSGSLYGAAFIRLLPIALATVARSVPGIALNVNVLKEAAFGVAIIGFLVLEPRGIAKVWRDIKDYFRLWPFKY